MKREIKSGLRRTNANISVKVPVDVTFRRMWPSEDIVNYVRDYAAKLQMLHGDVRHCRVVITDLSQRKSGKDIFRVCVIFSRQKRSIDEKPRKSKSWSIRENVVLRKALDTALRDGASYFQEVA